MLPLNQFHAGTPSSKPKTTFIRKELSISIDLTQEELDLIERAASVLDCDPKFFINDAVIWKARSVMKRLEYEHI